ncbi:MAG TPA: VWA domain-containing protein [Kofleriaceae bacterium]|nr:VWA domain-containing protein [Kofleriaceae bacterium]
MLNRIGELGALLRQNGVPVSVAEVMDAARAADAVGLADPLRLRDAMAACMVKRAADRALFDEIFDLAFLRGRGAAAARLAPLAELLRQAGLDADSAAALIDQIGAELAALSPLGRVALGMGAADLVALLRQAAEGADLGRMVSPLQTGFFTQRLLELLGLASAERELEALFARLADLGRVSRAAADTMTGVVRDNVQRLRQVAREHVAAEARQANLAAMERASSRALAGKPLASLSEKEVQELRGEVSRLARLLRARIHLVPRSPRRGRLDLRRTLRRSMATFGVPFDIRRRERRPRRPRLVVLCDISDSVRNVSRFLLELVYALQVQFDRVSTFAFVAELGELTRLFRENKVDRAISLAYTGAVVNVFANSNYGRVLGAFASRHLGLVSRRTTVLVIGDGRNNYHPSRADALAAIARRARQVLWLNPEPPPAWGFGDSAMREYAPYCDRVAVAHDLDSLRTVVDDLVLRPRHRGPRRRVPEPVASPSER